MNQTKLLYKIIVIKKQPVITHVSADLHQKKDVLTILNSII